MGIVANRTSEYLQERIDHLEKQLKSESVQSGVMKFTMEAMITELKQTQNVLNGGKSVFQQVKELDHAE